MISRRAALVLCPLVAILLYLPTLRHGFVLDDQGIIVANPLMNDLRSIPRLLVSPYWNGAQQGAGLYRPLTSLSFAVDRAIAGGPRPAWFHLVNILLHGVATLLVTLLALEVLGEGVPAGVAGLAFAAHPVHVEAVASVVGRSEILAAAGVLAAVLAHRRAQRSEGRRASRATTAAWGCGLLAMMAKESGAVVMLLCALADGAVPAAPPGIRRRRRRLWLYAGHLAVLVIFLAAHTMVTGALGAGRSIPFVDNPAAAAGPLEGRLTALGTVPRYAGLLLWPMRLSADYSFDQIGIVRSFSDPWALAGMLLVGMVLGGAVVLLPRAPAAGFSLLWMAIAASPTSNLVMFIGTLLAERLMYLPSVGLCLLAGWCVARARHGPARSVVLAAFLVACGALAMRSWARLPDWRDNFSLYRSAAQVSPRSCRVRYNLGNAHLQKEEYRQAEENYRLALAIYPEFNDARVNLGMALLQQGRAVEALAYLEAASEKRPGQADLTVNLGTAYRALGDLRRAEAEFRRALVIDPRSSRARNNLGSIALARGDAVQAVADLQEAVGLNPEAAIFRVNLADALVTAGRTAEADAQFEAANRLAPGDPEVRRGMGEVALRRGDLAGAEREFRAALAGSRPPARAANFLGYLLARRGDARGAADQYERALALDPTLFDAHNSLGLLYARRLGDPGRGAMHLQASLRAAPDQPEAEALRKLLRELLPQDRD